MTLPVVRPLGPQPSKQPFQLAANFENLELISRIRPRYQDASARQHRDQAFKSEPLQCLPYRGAPEPKIFSNLVLGNKLARP